MHDEAGCFSKFAHGWDLVVAGLWSDIEREWYEFGQNTACVSVFCLSCDCSGKKPLPLHETGFNV